VLFFLDFILLSLVFSFVPIFAQAPNIDSIPSKKQQSSRPVPGAEALLVSDAPSGRVGGSTIPVGKSPDVWGLTHCGCEAIYLTMFLVWHLELSVAVSSYA